MTDQEILDINIISALGIESLAEEQKVALLNDMATLVMKRTMLAVIETLSESQKNELEALVSGEGAESPAISEFLKNNVSSIDTMMQKELIAVKREMIEKATKIG